MNISVKINWVNFTDISATKSSITDYMVALNIFKLWWKPIKSYTPLVTVYVELGQFKLSKQFKNTSKFMLQNQYM